MGFQESLVHKNIAHIKIAFSTNTGLQCLQYSANRIETVEAIPQQIVNVKSVPRFQFFHGNDVHVDHNTSVVLLFSNRTWRKRS